jgi:hypothetical protein
MNISANLSQEELVSARYIRQLAIDKLYLEVYREFPKQIFSFTDLRFELQAQNQNIVLYGTLIFPSQHEWEF